MEFKTNHIGAYGEFPASIIELIVENWDGSSIIETITNLKDDKVDENLIISLRQLADELQEHNEKVYIKQ